MRSITFFMNTKLFYVNFAMGEQISQSYGPQISLHQMVNIFVNLYFVFVLIQNVKPIYNISI